MHETRVCMQLVYKEVNIVDLACRLSYKQGSIYWGRWEGNFPPKILKIAIVLIRKCPIIFPQNEFTFPISPSKMNFLDRTLISIMKPQNK